MSLIALSKFGMFDSCMKHVVNAGLSKHSAIKLMISLCFVRNKFVKSNNSKIELNEALIEKTGKLLGLKGYFTNLEEDIASNNAIMERYGELYKIEHAFRISKNDLETRPVFHYKEEPIKLHILICFMALALSKEIELKTGVSIRKFTTECKKVTDARILNLITSKEIRIRAKASQEIEAYLGNLNLSH